MEPACTEGRQALNRGGKTLHRGAKKPTTPTARAPTGKVRRRSSEVVPRRGQAKTLGRNKSCVDVGKTELPMAGSNARSSAARARRGSLSMLANQLLLLEEQKAGAARVRCDTRFAGTEMSLYSFNRQPNSRFWQHLTSWPTGVVRAFFLCPCWLSRVLCRDHSARVWYCD